MLPKPCKTATHRGRLILPKLHEDMHGKRYQCPLCGARGGTCATEAEALRNWNEMNDPTVGDAGML